jgi:uncharacterized protein YprB with RNaseH-like and TPR domain
LWREGLHDWNTFKKYNDEGNLPKWVKPYVIEEVLYSITQLNKHDHNYFRERLSHRELWRTFPEFRDDTVYLDIETTGLDSYHDDITIVGLYDGSDVKTFIKGRNLNKLPEILKKYSSIVTFNGLLFDLPFISKKFPRLEFDQIQLDLRFILNRLGFRGGLKKIERELGITRTSETVGLSGYDAVRLWRKFEKGNDEALELLIKYNTEDIVNLEKLMTFAYSKLRDETLK